MKPAKPIAWRRRAEERKQVLNAGLGIQVDADGQIKGFGLPAAAQKQSPSKRGASL